jgi:hypothetical protein
MVNPDSRSEQMENLIGQQLYRGQAIDTDNGCVEVFSRKDLAVIEAFDFDPEYPERGAVIAEALDGKQYNISRPEWEASAR